MSEQPTHPRPSQVTAAAVTAVVGCLLLVVALFDAMAQVRSLEMREAIERFLAEPPGDGLGISVAQVTSVLRVLVFVNGAVAAASVVLGIYALQRHKGARLGLTIAAAVMMLTAPVSGGFLPVVVAIAATLLWSRPARDWFDGRPPRPATVATSEPDPPADPWGSRPEATPGANAPGADPRADPGADVPAAPHPDRPAPASYPFGQGGGGVAGVGPTQNPYAQPYGQPQAQPYGGYGYPPGGYPAGPGVDRRPWTVTTAAVLTWVFAGLAAAAFGLTMLALTVAKDQVLTELERNPQFSGLDLSTGDFVAVVWAVSAIVVLWSLVAAVLAVLAFRRVGWARITLAVSAGMAALVSLLTIPVGVLHLLAAGAVVALLFTGGANAWYARRQPAWYGDPGGPSGPGGPSAPGGPSGPGAQPPYAGGPPHDAAPPPPPAPSGKPPVW